MPDAPHYPIYVSLDGRLCLVVGGGRVGERKIRSLLPCRAMVHLVAAHLSPWLEEQARSERIRQIGSSYDPVQLEGVDLVFAATGDKGVNRRVAEDARRRGIWCNMATDPDLGSFIVPSVFRQGPLTVAFSTGGLSPALARQIRERFEEQFDATWSLTLNLLGRLRSAVQSRQLATEENQRVFRELAGLPIPSWLASGEPQRMLQAIQEICGPYVSRQELTLIWEELCNQSCWPLPPSVTAAARSDI